MSEIASGMSVAFAYVRTSVPLVSQASVAVTGAYPKLLLSLGSSVEMMMRLEKSLVTVLALMVAPGCDDEVEIIPRAKTFGQYPGRTHE